MRYSIVIPVWDRTELLRQCLTSALSQSFDSYEVIVVTDGSPQPTREMLKLFDGHPKLRSFHYQTQSGTACRGRNRGIIEARGDYVVFLDSDDIALPNRLLEMESLLSRGDDDGQYILSARATYIGDGQRNVEGIVLNETSSSQQFVTYDRLRNGNSLVMSAVAIHRESLLQYGGFRPSLKYREDHELYLRLMYKGVKLLQSDNVVTLYRLHKENAELHLQQYDAEIVTQLDRQHREPFLDWGVSTDDKKNHSPFEGKTLSAEARPHRKSVIEIEIPKPWADHVLVGDAHRIYLANLLAVLGDHGTQVVLRNLEFGEDFRPRQTDCDALIAYHSVGSEPNVWRVKEGPIPYYFSFDRSGYSGWSDFSKQPNSLAVAQQIDPQEVASIVDRVRAETIQRNISKYPQPAPTNLNLEFDIFFPLQIRGDTVMKLCSVDYIEAIKRAFELAYEYKARLLVKRHPYCEDPEIAAIIKNVESRNAYVTVTNASIHSCLQSTETVLCCNSGVGFEALLHDKPVFSLGHSDYAAATDRITTLADMRLAFEKRSTIPPRSRNNFIAYYLSEYCFDVRDRSQLSEKIGRVLRSI